MRNTLKLLSAMTVGIVAVMSCRAQITTAPAPDSLPTPCIIRYDTQMQLAVPSGENVRTVLYKTDGTYSELAVSQSGSGTIAPHSGTFTYTVDPNNPAKVSIVYDDGNVDILYFTGANDGSYNLLPQSGSGPSLGSSTFALYPSQASAGGVNLSTRTTLTADGHAIVGFVIGGTVPRWVLLRADGVSLKQFGVSSPVTSPSFTVWNAKDQQIGASSVWSADPNLVPGFNSAFSLVGAFPLNAGSDEGVLMLPLKPGAYTMVLSAKSAGDTLGEVYFLPF